MQYIVLIHNNPEAVTEAKDWSVFFENAKNSGLFRGGSAIANSQIIGCESASPVSTAIGGYMRFDADDPKELRKLLNTHPVIKAGGALELYEMPRN